MITGQTKSFFFLTVLSLVAVLLYFSAIPVRSQRRSHDVYVDNKGVMRWGQSREEVRAFGLNYTAMFAHAYGGIITVEPEKDDYELSLSELKKVKLVTLPRPYPGFLPYFFEAGAPGSFDIRRVEVLQLTIGPGISDDDQQRGIAIESIRLE